MQKGGTARGSRPPEASNCANGPTALPVLSRRIVNAMAYSAILFLGELALRVGVKCRAQLERETAQPRRLELLRLQRILLLRRLGLGLAEIGAVLGEQVDEAAALRGHLASN